MTIALPGLDRDDPEAVAAAIAWLDWYDARPVPAGTTTPAWRPERLEYEFSIAAHATANVPAAVGEHVLVADDHAGGPLDWWSFDLHPWAAVGAGDDPAPQQITSSALPTGLVLAGLPAARFWEFEPGDVNLDAVSAAPEDLGRLLLTEFAVAYGNDFFIVPVEVDAGSIAAVRRLTVRTTFGETYDVPDTATADWAAGRRSFRLFQLSVPGGEPAPLLIVLTGVTAGLEGEAVEDVLIARDEMANLAWAVERRVPGVDGRGEDRAEALHRVTPETPIVDGSPHPPSLRYQLATQMPANWMALLPRAADAAGAPRPVRRLTSADDPVGRLLTAGGAALRAAGTPRRHAAATRPARSHHRRPDPNVDGPPARQRTG